LIPTTHCSVKLIPLKKGSDGSFADVDLEVSCKKEGADKAEIDAVKVIKGVLNVERRVQLFYLGDEFIMGSLQFFDDRGGIWDALRK
jgi:hypothetical protein